MDKRLAPVQFSVPATFAKPTDDGSRAFEGVAYGGGVITDHPWFERVAFDLSTTTFDTPAPALYNHREPVGVISQAKVDGKITIAGKLFADLEGPAQQIAMMADRGMPWQMSVGIIPGSIEEVRPGVKVELNGQTIDGPLTVFRQSRIRETSFCPSERTTARARKCSRSAESAATTTTEFTDMADTITKEAHDAAIATRDTEITQLKGRIDALQAQFAARRNADVLELFAATGRTFKDDAERTAAAKPYLAMDEEAFAAVSGDLKRAKPVKRDQRLFSHTATEGPGVDGEGNDPARSGLVASMKNRFGIK
jgi:hypothetical protein